ncbi:ribose-phosphate diphosphokinase [Candidatus Vidania fulgoroideorum]
MENVLISNYNKNFFKNIKNIKKIKVNFKTFKDKEIEINYINRKNYKNSIIVFSINRNIEKTIFKIFLLIEILKKKSKKVILILPYLRYSRQDKFENQKSSSLKLFVKILEMVGVNTLITFDIHSIQTIGFSEKMIIENISLFPIIIKYIKKKIKNFYIIFPDIGSYNRYKNFVKKDRYLVINKSRLGKKINLIKQQDLSKIINKKINLIIFDDIIDSGNTIIKIIKTMRKKLNIYVFSIHPVLSSFKLLKYKFVKKIYFFNTIKKYIQTKKIKVFSLKKIFKKIIKKCLI